LIGALFNANSSHASLLTIIGSPYDVQRVSVFCGAVGDTGMLTIFTILWSTSSYSLEVMKLALGIHLTEAEIAKP
jgi:hypothetical protein